MTDSPTERGGAPPARLGSAGLVIGALVLVACSLWSTAAGGVLGVGGGWETMLALAGTVLAAALVLSLLAFHPLGLALSGRDRSTIACPPAPDSAVLTDALTGLRNHRAFHEDLARALQRAHRSGQPLSVVLLDLNGLTLVNESLGHRAGDERLRALAAALLATTRGGDGVYRLGGDEFAAVLAGERAWGGLRFSQRLQASLDTLPTPTRLVVTAGVAEALGPMYKETLLRRTTLALREARRSHHGAIIYTDALEPRPLGLEDTPERQHLKAVAAALARAVDVKDSYTRSHCETVGETAALIAEELGLEPEHVAKVRLAGLLHDVGKIGIADTILLKPAELTELEFAVMKTHSSLGHRIVCGASLNEEAEWILHHHERVDGRGYPDGLRGEEVPIEARIILVADAFEAITSDRPYRPAGSDAAAFAELERHAGTHFDPRCVMALVRALTSQSAHPLAGHSVQPAA